MDRVLRLRGNAGKLVAGPSPAYAYATSYSQGSTTNVIQPVGVAASATELVYERGEPVTIVS